MQTKSIKQQVFEFLTSPSTYHLGLSTLDALRLFKTTELRKIISDLNNEQFAYQSQSCSSTRSKFVAIKRKKPTKFTCKIFLERLH